MALRGKFSPRALALAAVATVGLAVFAAGAVLHSAVSHAKPKTTGAHEIVVDAQPIAAFDKADPARTKFGKLEWRGGLVLTSPDAGFGGWSAMTIDSNGKRVLLISDTGVWLTGDMRYDGVRPVGISGARLGPVLGPGGARLKPGFEDDSEGVALVSGNLAKGEVLISFERKHRIGRFSITTEGLGPQTGAVALPAEASRMEFNRSLESVCQLKAGPLKGSIVTLAERYPSADGQHMGWLLGPGPRLMRTLRVTNIDGFDLTDCAGLDDGGMLVLERRYRLRDLFEGPKMRLRRFTAEEVQAALSSGEAMAGDALIEATAGEEIDNMEGLALHRGAAGELVITMISDNNFNRILQRTVLLQFALAPPPTEAASRR